MKRTLSESQRIEFAHLVKNNLFREKSSTIKVFLCGGDVTDEKFGRYKLAQALNKKKRFEIFYPEDLFDDLLAGQGQHSLLSLENILADSVDVIIIIPESPGSYSELGAFSNNAKLSQKMICVQDNKYRFKKSFLNYGPIRLLKSINSKSVLRCDFNILDDLRENSDFYHKLEKSINSIMKRVRVKQSISNILYADKFVLPCIYLMDGINNVLLYDLLNKATGQDKILSEIIVKSALSRLLKRRVIMRTSQGYHITDPGMEYVASKFNRQSLDRLRLEMMNFQNRSKASLNYVKLLPAHP